MNDYLRSIAPHEIDGETLTLAEQEAYIERWCIVVESGHITESAACAIADDTVRNMRNGVNNG